MRTFFLIASSEIYLLTFSVPFCSLPAYWAADGTIVVNDTVRINKPYGVNDLQASASNAGGLQHVKKILEAHYAKQKAKAPQAAAPPASNRNSVAMPLAPRKGG